MDYGHRHKSVKPFVPSVLAIIDEYAGSSSSSNDGSSSSNGNSSSSSGSGRGARDITMMYPTEELRTEHKEAYDAIVPWMRNESGHIDEVGKRPF